MGELHSAVDVCALSQKDSMVNEDGILCAYKTGDAVIETDRIMTWNIEDAVKLRMRDHGEAAEPPVTYMTALQRTIDRAPNRTALAFKKEGIWNTISFTEYQAKIRQTARGFIKLGLEPSHGVGIIGFNSPEWILSDLGAIFAGGYAVGIYTTNSPEACYYVLSDSRCHIAVVENENQLKKILEVRDRLPHLKAIVQYVGTPSTEHSGVYSWDQLMSFGYLGDCDLDGILDERIKVQAPNKCCTIIYTSGTTGNPKGVMLSHDNMTWSGTAAAKNARLRVDDEILISFLPLSHAAGQMLDIAAAVTYGFSIYFAQPDALKGSLGETIREVRPTMFGGVPRVFEKIQEAMMSAGKQQGTVKRWVSQWAKRAGLEGNLAKINGKTPSYSYSLAERFIFPKVRTALGFDRCRIIVSGAAPMNRDTLEYFLSLNLSVVEWYGMSESAGTQQAGVPWNFRLGSCGMEMNGMELSLEKSTVENLENDGSGEICMGGRNVFMGYLNLEEQTKAAFNDKGWLRSGDIARKDSEGFVYITGRVKEIIITAGGENIPPVSIENRVKEVLPCVSNCILIGDRRKFLSLLIALKTDLDKETQEPLDSLAPVTLEWCKSIGCSCIRLSDILAEHNPAVMAAIEAGIRTVNKNATSQAQYIQKWSLIPRDFSVHGGELGPTLKLKRNVVTQLYSSTIEGFYREAASA